MKIYTYVNYGGNCREAFEFYAANLGGKVTMMSLHKEQPPGSRIIPGWEDKVLHARLEIGGTVLMGADIPPDVHQPMRSAYLTLMVDSVDEAERDYKLLVEGGEIFMPIQESFFAKRFAMFRDRFGTSWMLLGESA